MYSSLTEDPVVVVIGPEEETVSVCVDTVVKKVVALVTVTVVPEVTVTVETGPGTVTVATGCGNLFEQKS